MKRTILAGCLVFAALPVAAESTPVETKPTTWSCALDLSARQAPSTSPVVNQAFQDLINVILQPPTQAEKYFPSDIANWLKNRPFNKAMKALARLSVPSIERESICRGFVQIAIQYKMVNNTPLALDPVIQNLCGQPFRRAALLVLTEAALNTPPGAFPQRAELPATDHVPGGNEARQWLEYVISKGTLSVPDWKRLLAMDPKNRIIPLADAVDGRWDKVGLRPNEVIDFARLIISKDVSLTYTLNAMGLTDAVADQFIGDLNPVQWLELRQLRHQLYSDPLPELKQRVRAYVPRNSAYHGEGAVEVGLLMLEDEQFFKYDYAIETFKFLEKNWAKIYGKGTVLNQVFPLPEKLSNEEKLRLARFQADDASKTKLIAKEVSRQAKLVKEVIEQTKMTTPAEFLNAFDLRKIFPEHAEPILVEADLIRLNAIGTVYYKMLWAKRAEFMAMNPTGADLARLASQTLGLPPRLRARLLTSLRRMTPKTKDGSTPSAAANADAAVTDGATTAPATPKSRTRKPKASTATGKTNATDANAGTEMPADVTPSNGSTPSTSATPANDGTLSTGATPGNNTTP